MSGTQTLTLERTQEAEEPAHKRPLFSTAAEYPISNVGGYFVQKAIRISLFVIA